MDFLEWKLWILINISLKFVPEGKINNISALVQIMIWCLVGDKSLSEPMVVSLLVHRCVTQPQWVNFLPYIPYIFACKFTSSRCLFELPNFSIRNYHCRLLIFSQCLELESSLLFGNMNPFSAPTFKNHMLDKNVLSIQNLIFCTVFQQPVQNHNSLTHWSLHSDAYICVYICIYAYIYISELSSHLFR